jgi:hypothetical protein
VLWAPIHPGHHLEISDAALLIDASAVAVLVQVYGRRQGRTGVRLSIGGLRPEALLSQLTDMGFDAQAAQAVLSQVGPSLDLAVQMLLGGHPGRPRASSAGGAAAGAASAASSGGSRDPAQAQAQRSSQEGIEAQPAQAAAAATGAAGSAVAEAQPAERAATLSGGGAAAEASEAATSERWHSQQEGDPDEFEDGEDEEEAEDEDDEVRLGDVP